MAARRGRRTKKERGSMVQIYGAIFSAFSLIVLLHSYTGFLGSLFYRIGRFLFGDWYFVVFALILILGLYMIWMKQLPSMSTNRMTGVGLTLAGLLLVKAIPEGRLTGAEAMHSFYDYAQQIWDGTYPAYGGFLANLIYSGLSAVLSFWGTVIVLIVLFAVGILFIIDVDNLKKIGADFRTMRRDSAERSRQRRQQQHQQQLAQKQEKAEQMTLNLEDKIVTHEPEPLVRDNTPTTELEPVRASEPVVSVPEDPRPNTAATASVDPGSYANYKLPRMTLLDNAAASKSSANKNNAKEKGQMLIEILNQFDVPCELQEIHIGPSVTKFEVKPQPGIKVSRITSLQENIKMALAVKDVRIEAPVPGKNAVGIEIPNIERNTVHMCELMRSFPEKLAGRKLAVGLGKDLSGDCVYMEIDKMPHLLIAGATGSGKSVCINSIITSLLLRTTPNEVKLLLIDPKKVEFTPYQEIPNLIGPVISDPGEASTALKTIVAIMENRYQEFHNRGVRDIREYNRQADAGTEGFRHMVYIVVIIDELADLMVTNGKDVEANIQRITQLARASGIHLIVATQRPSTDVITGVIKANIPSRIAFAVSSAIDSRIILDQTGAETLLGNGDMLYIPLGSSNATRIQGVYVSDDEIKRITEFVKSQGKPHYDDAFVAGQDGATTLVNNISADPLYEDVKKFVAQTGKASTSSIQRYFGFGYNRAARIIDQLEQEGAIGPANGSKPREVYMHPEDFQ